MEIEDEFLRQTLECLKAHRRPKLGDRFPIDVFNRLLAKNVRPNGWTKNTHMDFLSAEIRSRGERWNTAGLGRLTRGHAGTEGDDFACPIILVEYDGKTRVLDGNHRINRWVASNDQRLHDVNIHAVERVGMFVELAAVSRVDD